MDLSRADVESIAEAAADKAVRRLLTELGIEHHDPLEMQADFLHLRRWRRVTERAAGRFLLTAIGIVTAGGLAALWLGFKASIGDK